MPTSTLSTWCQPTRAAFSRESSVFDVTKLVLTNKLKLIKFALTLADWSNISELMHLNKFSIEITTSFQLGFSLLALKLFVFHL